MAAECIGQFLNQGYLVFLTDTSTDRHDDLRLCQIDAARLALLDFDELGLKLLLSGRPRRFFVLFLGWFSTGVAAPLSMVAICGVASISTSWTNLPLKALRTKRTLPVLEGDIGTAGREWDVEAAGH